MLRRIAGLAVTSLSTVWLIYVWRLYVRSPGDALFYIGWVIIYAILWGYSILLRQRDAPEAQARAQIVGLIIFIPVIAYLVQSLLGRDYRMIEMAAILSVFGLFISWGYRLYKQP
jgi:hypothetical protein